MSVTINDDQLDRVMNHVLGARSGVVLLDEGFQLTVIAEEGEGYVRLYLFSPSWRIRGSQLRMLRRCKRENVTREYIREILGKARS
jgi:hypothetical protein